MNIRIVNPLPGENPWTSEKRAAKMVARGKAKFIDSGRAIAFLNRAGWLAAANAHAAVANLGYDACNAHMTLRKMRAIPVCRPEVLLYG
jgi:hypothetical protein